ncbi:MAG: CCA tRNA nucleotidyltransferase, partial [Nitratireductor sp.]
MEALEAEGGTARFVGGCVRNSLLGEPVTDVDIATTETPDRAQALLEAKGIKVIPTGIEHGTVTAVAEGRHFEITTLRVDVATHGRHADVEFTEDWVEDAKRR